LANEIGRQVMIAADSFPVDLMVVYKGNYLPRWALESVRARGVYCLNIWPDGSMTEHGVEILRCLPVYDCIFTTKSFGARDLGALGVATASEFVPDVYDPDFERWLRPSKADFSIMGCDVGFIGAWTPRKERYLRALAERAPGIRMRVWGDGWIQRAHSLGRLATAIEGRCVFGDLYALAVACTTINLGLLTEIRPGASSGDVTTSRTFEIPACGGFMLHERTDEVLTFFDDGTEIACFRDESELLDRVTYYLSHDAEREKMRHAAYERCIAKYSVDGLVERIIGRYEQYGIR
jgi:hypothetical protein